MLVALGTAGTRLPAADGGATVPGLGQKTGLAS